LCRNSAKKSDETTGFLVPPEISPFSFSSDVVNEGIYAQVSCIVQSGDLPITITWSLKGDVISSEPGLMTAQLGQRASILSIDSVGYRHSGTYTCTARNEAGSASASAELKVNGSRPLCCTRGQCYDFDFFNFCRKI
jgi:hypothetical protein